MNDCGLWIADCGFERSVGRFVAQTFVSALGAFRGRGANRNASRLEELFSCRKLGA